MLHLSNDFRAMSEGLMRWEASCDTARMETQGDRIDDCLIALRRILRATWLHERELAQAAGLTPAQLRVLQILNGRPDGSTTPKALAL